MGIKDILKTTTRGIYVTTFLYRFNTSLFTCVFNDSWRVLIGVF